MLDIQKERLRQLMAGAILELWKKETGSLASVFIEATVCITSCNSRMTVIQLSDHFPGMIPEPSICLEKAFHVGGDVTRVPGRLCQAAGKKRKMAEDDRWERIAGGGDGKMMEVSSVDASGGPQRHLHMDSNNNQTVIGDEDYNEETDRDDISSEENEEEEEEEEAASDADDRRRSTSGDSSSGLVGLLVPGTGFYARATERNGKTREPAGDDSAIQDMSTGSVVIDDDCSTDSSLVDSKCRTSSEVRWGTGRGGGGGGGGGGVNELVGTVDVTQHDPDLLLSSPQNYTEQVRDVIRSRLLNGKPTTIGAKSPGDFLQMPVPGSTQRATSVSSSSSLGLERCFDMATPWSLIKREKQMIAMDGRMRQFPLPPLHLVPLAAAATNSQMPMTHPSVHRFLGISNGPLESPESKVFPESPKVTTELDDKQEVRSAGLTSLPFSDQKLGKFDASVDGSPTIGNEQKTYRCGFCQKTFLFKSKYHEHLPVHTSARPFECHMCTRTYKYKYDLRVHLRTHLGIPTKSTICPFCSGKYLTNKLLRNHIKEAHREQQQISEEQCAQSLESVAELSLSISSV